MKTSTKTEDEREADRIIEEAGPLLDRVYFRWADWPPGKEIESSETEPLEMIRGLLGDDATIDDAEQIEDP